MEAKPQEEVVVDSPPMADKPVSTANANNTKFKKSKLFWVLGGIAAIAIVVAAFFLFNNNKKTGNSTAKVYHVGMIALNAFGNMPDGFKSKMTELGYVEGKNIFYDVRNHSIDLDGMQESLDDFVENKVDLVFTTGTPPSLMAKKTVASAGIPVVFANASMEGNGLVDSVQQPGGNITGVRFQGSDVVIKRLELLLEIVPEAKRIWVAYQDINPSALSVIGPLRSAAKSKGITLIEVPLKKVTDINLDLQARAVSGDPGIDAILIMPEGFTQSSEGWPVIREFAIEHKIAIGGSAFFEADDGAIFSYGSDNFETGKLAAPLADKIFKGISAGKIPVVTPESSLRLSYKTALEIGIKLPESLLSRADEIIR